MKVVNIIIIDGKEVDASTLPEEERKRIFHEINVNFMKRFGYVPVSDTEETA